MCAITYDNIQITPNIQANKTPAMVFTNGIYAKPSVKSNISPNV